MLKYLWGFLVFSVLTILTQIGGVVYLASKLLHHWLRLRVPVGIVFVALYLAATLIVVPAISTREALPWSARGGEYGPASFVFPLLHRNYVVPELKQVLDEVGEEEAHRFFYLDAGFPFAPNFPMLPHLSHKNGRQIDIAFHYAREGERAVRTPTLIGYGSIEPPRPGEVDMPAQCKARGNPIYSMTRLFPVWVSDLSFDAAATRQLVESFTARGGVRKIFIEPHLKQRLDLNNAKIRFHGCRAVRHDDHIHVEL